MVIEVIIDHATGKIVGYNTAIPVDKDGIILVDDGELPRLANADPFDRLYYVGGEIVEKEPDEYYRRMEVINCQYAKLQEGAKDEYKLFMDSIIDGGTIADAAGAVAEKREALKEVERQRGLLVAEHGQRIEAALLKKFEEEEDIIEYPYFLSMVTVVRDENDYLEEWIRYHIEELGFDHFYIYDNESAVPASEYLESVNFRYLDRVTFIPWKTSENTQQDSHNDFLRRFGKETKWFLPADPDEYVVLKGDGAGLKEILEQNGQYAIIECIWHYFNAGGQEEKTEGTDMERFTSEVDWWYGKGRGKRFAQSNRIKSMVNHVPQPRAYAKVNSNKDEEFFQLNHYYTRSYEEWVGKMARGTVVPYCRKRHSEFFELNPDMAYLETAEDYEQEYGHAGSREGA